MLRLALLIIFLFPLTAFALDAAFECQGAKLKAELASTELAKVQSRYAKVESLKAEFAQHSYMSALDISENSMGEVLFQRPGLMRWEYAVPHPQTFLVREKTMWFFQPREKQVLIDTLSDVLISELPVAFLLGLGNLTQDFKLVSACTTKQGLKFELQEKPNQAKSAGNLAGFQLAVDAEHLPSGAIITDVGGNVTRIVLKKTVVNTAITASEFAATFPSGIDIIDRRNAASGTENK